MNIFIDQIRSIIKCNSEFCRVWRWYTRWWKVGKIDIGTTLCVISIWWNNSTCWLYKTRYWCYSVVHNILFVITKIECIILNFIPCKKSRITRRCHRDNDWRVINRTNCRCHLNRACRRNKKNRRTECRNQKKREKQSFHKEEWIKYYFVSFLLFSIASISSFFNLSLDAGTATRI